MSQPVPSYNCFICKICCSGPESYMQHKASIKHKKKEQFMHMELASNQSRPDERPNLRIASPVPAFQGGSISMSPYHCKTCQTVMTGPESYQAHIAGQPHAKRMRQQKLLEQMNSAGDGLFQTSNYSDFLTDQKNTVTPHSAQVTTSTIDSILRDVKHKSTDIEQTRNYEMTISFCGVCQVSISGVENAQQHYIGSQHSKKSARLGLTRTGSEDFMAASANSLGTLQLEENQPPEEIEEIKSDEDAEVVLRRIFKEMEQKIAYDLFEED